MADDTETQSNAAAEATATEQPQPTGEIPPEVKRALSKANKEAETLRLKLKEFEDRDKSDLERLTERAETAEKAVVDAEVRSLRLEVAAEKGLTPAQAKRLVGESREELESDAQELLDTFKPVNNDESPDVAESLDLGNRGLVPKSGKSTADLFAAAVEPSFTR